MHRAVDCTSIALRLDYIALGRFEKLADRYAKTSYGEYLLGIYQSFVNLGGVEL